MVARTPLDLWASHCYCPVAFLSNVPIGMLVVENDQFGQGGSGQRNAIVKKELSHSFSFVLAG
eukprot:COSAG06_NODE_12594_length_1358_cov_1.629071_2_plen_63_part_00